MSDLVTFYRQLFHKFTGPSCHPNIRNPGYYDVMLSFYQLFLNYWSIQVHSHDMDTDAQIIMYIATYNLAYFGYITYICNKGHMGDQRLSPDPSKCYLCPLTKRIHTHRHTHTHTHTHTHARTYTHSNTLLKQSRALALVVPCTLYNS